jgi:DUF1680 family protein
MRESMVRILITVSSLLIVTVSAVSAQNKDYPITSVPFTKVKLTDKFWLPRIRTNHEVTIPASFERCENTGRVKNFEMAAAKSGAFCTVYPFDDTDIYKTIEGASFSMSLYPDPKLDAYIDGLIVKVAAAQEPDGYLYTARTIDPAHPHKWSGNERWVKERELSHELYNSGHLFEAAAAHYQSTGKRNLLDIALKNADLVCATFGPNKLHVAPGHEVVEMGLVKLYRITGKKEYLETAKYFIDERGHYSGYDPNSKDQWKNGAYWQDHIPVIEQEEALGHAVRAGYLYAAVADIAALTGDPAYLNAIDKIWDNVVGKKLYVQGGIGAIGDGEKFGANYELPNSTAYNETCAAIANVYWNQRMFQLHGDAKYVDVLERSLYNGLISGVGMDGKSFFYTNAMEIRNNFSHKDMERTRSGWFPCSCCPTNITRLVPSIPGYMYAIKDDQVYVNLFANSTASLKDLEIIQENNYPWSGDLIFKVNPRSAKNFKMMIRIPGWARGEVVSSDLYSFENKDIRKVAITINGKAIDYTVDKGYAVISRSWKKGDVVNMSLPMDVQKVISNPKVENNIGRVALQRGPLVYCAEWVDNNGLVSNLLLSPNASFQTDIMNGMTTLKSTAQAITIDPTTNSVSSKTQPLVLIPYYSWAHRGEGEMMVWLPEKISSIDIISK